jgi:nucleoside-diphosphate-sugar epimerase
MIMARDLVIVGCGYSGEAIGRAAVAQEMRVLATTRSVTRAAELQHAGFEAWRIDPGLAPASGTMVPALAPDAWGVISVPPGPDAHIQAWLVWMARQRVSRVAYLSATSVYGSCNGGWVDEQSATAPDSVRGVERLRAEQEFAACCEKLSIEPVVVRLPGIHGPGRTLRDRMESGHYRLVDDGLMFTNRIHVADIATATLFLLRHPQGVGTWIVSDDEPFQVHELVSWMCEVLELPRPPVISIEDVPASMRDFWQGNRRCSNRAIRNLGWSPQYPNFRAALLSSWADEGRPVPAP